MIKSLIGIWKTLTGIRYNAGTQGSMSSVEKNKHCEHSAPCLRSGSAMSRLNSMSSRIIVTKRQQQYHSFSTSAATRCALSSWRHIRIAVPFDNSDVRTYYTLHHTCHCYVDTSLYQHQYTRHIAYPYRQASRHSLRYSQHIQLHARRSLGCNQDWLCYKLLQGHRAQIYRLSQCLRYLLDIRMSLLTLSHTLFLT